MALQPVDKTVNIDVQAGNSVNQVRQLSDAFKLLEAKIEDIGQALTGLNAKSRDPVSGQMGANQEYNKLLKERLDTLRQLGQVLRTVSQGSVDAQFNRANSTSNRNTQSFTGAGLSAREVETVQKRIKDFRTASASEEARQMSRRKTNLEEVNTLEKANLAIEAQILKVIKQKNDIETKGATTARLATQQRYNDELRQLVNLQSTLKRQQVEQRRMQIDNRLGVSTGNSQFGGAARGINGQISLFRSQIAQLNLLDASVQQTSRDTIKGFRDMAQAAGVYLPKMQSTIQNVENALNNATSKQMRTEQIRQLAELRDAAKRQEAIVRQGNTETRTGNQQFSGTASGLRDQIGLFRAQMVQMDLSDKANQEWARNQIRGFRDAAQASGVYLTKLKTTIQNAENAVENSINRQNRLAARGALPSASEVKIGDLSSKVSALVGTTDPKLQLQLIDLQVRLAREKLKSLDISKGQTAEYIKQSKELNELIAEQRRLRSTDNITGANLTNRTAAAGAVRSDAVFGSGAADFFKFQAGLILNYTLLTKMQQAITGAAAEVIGLDTAMKDLQAITGANNTEIAVLNDAILETAASTKFLNTEVAEGAKVLAQAGLSVGEIQNSLKGVALFASATGTSFKDSADLMTSALSVFNLRASETTNLANLFTAALNFSKLNSEQLGLAIQYVANTAAQAGLPIEELVADVASLANAGIRSGSTIGTGLRQVLIDLMNPSEKLQGRLKVLGLTMGDINVQTNGLSTVIRTLTEAGFGVGDAFATMEVRGAAAFVALQGQQKGYNDLLNSIVGTNAAVEANNTQMQALSNTARNTATIFSGLASKAFEPTVQTLQAMLAGFNDVLKAMTDLAPVVQIVALGVSAIGTGFGIAFLARLLGVGAAVAGLTTALTAGAFAFKAWVAGAATAGEALAFMSGPTGWIVLGTVAVFGLVYAFTQLESASEKAARAVDEAQASVGAAKARYDDQTKAIQNVNQEMNRMSVQEKVLRGDKDALSNTVARLNERFGDLGLSLDGTYNTFDKVVGKVREFREELQNRTALAIIDLQSQLERLNDAQQKALQQSNPGYINQGLGRTTLGGYASGTSGNPLSDRYLTAGQKSRMGAAQTSLPTNVNQAINDSNNFTAGQTLQQVQGMLDTLARARGEISGILRDNTKLEDLAQQFSMSADEMKTALQQLFDESVAQTRKLTDIAKTQRQDLAVQAQKRINDLATGPLSPARLLGEAASFLGNQYTKLSANAPADALTKSDYIKQNGGNLIRKALGGIESLSRLGGSEFQQAVDIASGGSLSNITSEVNKSMIDITANAVEDWKKLLPDLLKSASTGMRLSGQNLENNFGSSGFQGALDQYMNSLQMQLGLIAKDFAMSIGKDPSLVGFNMSTFTATNLGDMSDSQNRELASTITNQIVDVFVKAAQGVTDNLKRQVDQATSDDQIDVLRENANTAVQAIYDPMIAGLQKIVNTPGMTQAEVDAANINLQGALDARNAALVAVSDTTAKGMADLTKKAEQAQAGIVNSIIEAADGLPTQVLSKEERASLRSTLEKILQAKKESIIRGFMADIMALPGAMQDFALPFGLGSIKVPTKETADQLGMLDKVLSADNQHTLNKFDNPKKYKYGGGGGSSHRNERLLKPFEQFEDRRSEIDRQFDQSTRSLQENSRTTGISLDAVDYMKGYSAVERAALEAIQKQQQSSELPKVMQAEQVRLDSLKSLLDDFNKINVPRLEELKKTYDDPSKSNGARNAALTEYNKILKDQRGLQDGVTESTNSLADAQERYNVSIGKGVGQNLSFWDQMNAAIDQFSEGNGSFTDQLANSIPDVLNNMSNSFNTFFTDVVEGTKTVGEAFEDLGKNIVSSLLNALTQAASNSIVSELFGGTTGGGKGGGGGLLSGLLNGLGSLLGFGGSAPAGPDGPKGQESYAPSSGGGTDWIASAISFISGFFNGGGIVRAAKGYVARDSKLALVRPGEGILRNTAMDAIGVDNFERLNALGNNMVTQSRPDAAPMFAKPVQQIRQGDINYNITTPDADSFRRSQNQILSRTSGALNRARRSLA